jgi:hypothetical protein
MALFVMVLTAIATEMGGNVQEISWLAASRLASQEGLCSME